jgi:catechol 2,3-dioxygenase-like lactoylglutathione lyase family enzyme
MLGGSPAVAFATVTDLGRARAFYEGVLGLKVLRHDGFAVLLEAGDGTQVRISGAPALVPQPFTVCGFNVRDIDAVVDGLMDRGVAFERFAFFGPSQDDRGLWTAPSGDKVAWFKDPEGNLLSVQQMVGG